MNRTPISPSAGPVDTASWRPLVVCPDPELSRRILAALAEAGMRDAPHMEEYPQAGAIATLDAEFHSNICFVDLFSNQDRGLLLVSEAASVMPVVSLHPHHDADLILRALRRGACEFLSDLSGEQVRGVLERLRQRRNPPKTGAACAVYCFMPGKPGCGASTLAAQFATELKRLGVTRVLLIDADFLTASIGFQLKLKSDYHLGDALRDLKRMDADLWTRLTVPCHGVDVLLGPEDCSMPLEMGRAEAIELLSFLGRRYDIVIFDVPGPKMAVETGLAQLAGDLILVATNELSSLHATRRAIDYLEHSGVARERIKLVLNRYTPRTGIKREDVRTVLKLEPLAAVTNDYEAIQSAVLEGRPVPEGAAFSHSVANLAKALCHGKEGSPAAEKASGWLSFFGRRK